jgi:formate dehydrogenase subunit delta
MNLDRLVTMANEIAAFFDVERDKTSAAQQMTTHLRRYWDPRMRQAIVAHWQTGGAGLHPLAKQAIASLTSA